MPPPVVMQVAAQADRGHIHSTRPACPQRIESARGVPAPLMYTPLAHVCIPRLDRESYKCFHKSQWFLIFNDRACVVTFGGKMAQVPAPPTSRALGWRSTPISPRSELRADRKGAGEKALDISLPRSLRPPSFPGPLFGGDAPVDADQGRRPQPFPMMRCSQDMAAPAPAPFLVIAYRRTTPSRRLRLVRSLAVARRGPP